MFLPIGSGEPGRLRLAPFSDSSARGLTVSKRERFGPDPMAETVRCGCRLQPHRAKRHAGKGPAAAPQPLARPGMG